MVKVLLVEDDESLRSLYSKVLKDNKYEVETAVDGEDSFIKIDSFKPDVIILDIDMPKLNGIEVLRILKADPELKKIPVIMFTSSSDSNRLKECYQIGVRGYIMKDSSTAHENVKKIDMFIKTLR
jgi:CheY-like chemotaxis protein